MCVNLHEEMMLIHPKKEVRIIFHFLSEIEGINDKISMDESSLTISSMVGSIGEQNMTEEGATATEGGVGATVTESGDEVTENNTCNGVSV